MHPVQKKLTIVLWALAILAAGVFFASRMRQRPVDVDMPVLEPIGTVPEFALTNQDGQTVTLDTLRGQPWIADFIFTRCGGPCPIMTSKMAGLQEKLPGSIKLVSFSVDPEFDTPEVLKSYAKKFNADESRWHFLTGTKDAIFALARGMLLVAIPANEANPIIHDERFLLVDGLGQIRGAYHSNDPQEMKQLELDAQELAKESGT
jgi:protein SCO1/2